MKLTLRSSRRHIHILWSSAGRQRQGFHTMLGPCPCRGYLTPAPGQSPPHTSHQSGTGNPHHTLLKTAQCSFCSLLTAMISVLLSCSFFIMFSFVVSRGCMSWCGHMHQALSYSLHFDQAVQCYLCLEMTVLFVHYSL